MTARLYTSNASCRNTNRCGSAARLLSAAVACVFLSGQADAQRHDMRWLGGYSGSSGDPDFGGNKTMFGLQDPATSIAQEHGLNIYTSVGVFTDESDSIIAYTDAWVVGNRNFQVMPNGSGLNPTPYLTPGTGFTRPSSHIFLPWPGRPDSIALFHMIRDAVSPEGVNHSIRLYLSIIDRSLDNGNGDVVLKNHVVAELPMISGGLVAARHANGRDWWVIAHGFENNNHLVFLLTPSGASGPDIQPIGTYETGFTGGKVFSPDGDKLAVASLDGGTGFIDLYDFDRCTGILSNWRTNLLDPPTEVRGASFSPNGRMLYVSMVLRVLQFDLSNNQLEAPTEVALYDGYFDGIPELGTYFDLMMLAPDGRIYTSTGNSTHYLHVMHEPDVVGIACQMVQHEHYLPKWSFNSIPYRPNYLLGPIDGTVCDSLGISNGMNDEDLRAGVAAFPNPGNGAFTLSYPGQRIAGELEIIDMAGRTVQLRRLPAWSQIHRLDLDAVPGMYLCRFTWGQQRAMLRLILQP